MCVCVCVCVQEVGKGCGKMSREVWFGKSMGYNVKENEPQNIDAKTYSPECNV